MSLLHNRLGRRAEEIECLQKALTLSRENPLVHSYLGYAYHGMGDAGRAKHHLEACLRVTPENAKAQWCLGEIHLAPGVTLCEFEKIETLKGGITSHGGGGSI